ncbi:MAG: transaldolase [Thiobacillus sp.]
MNAIKQIAELGQSLWLDNLSRGLIKQGTLARLIHDDGVSGLTSNPSIFHNAISTGDDYADDLARLKQTESDPERRYELLVIPDIQAACDLVRPVFERTQGDDGYVSLEVAPHLAYNEEGTVAEAQSLAAAVARDNLLIKLPGTAQGISAFETLTRLGINVNVTLLFSVKQTERIWEAYIRGLTARVAAGLDIRSSKAVASLFLSRVDTLIDARLTEMGTPEAMALRGKAAVAMAKNAYRRYEELFKDTSFAHLQQVGGRPQYLLWASTGVKNPAYSDLLYVEPLIGTETINTLPDKTLDAIRDHAKPALNLPLGLGEANTQLEQLARLGIDMDSIGETLQADGVKQFASAFDKLLALVT